MKFVFVLSFLVSHIVNAQSAESVEANFSVLRNDEVVGTLQASRTQINENIIFTLSSSVKINALITMRIRETMMSEFENNVLINSLHKRTINDFTAIDNVVLKSGDNYVCDDETLYHVGPIISNSTLSLYFQEPHSIDSVYSEIHMQKIPVSKLETGIYSLKLPNDKSTKYYYESGMLVKVEAHTKWGIVTFQRSNSVATR